MFSGRDKSEIVVLNFYSKKLKTPQISLNVSVIFIHFGGLETSFRNIEKLASFQQMFYSMHVFWDSIVSSSVLKCYEKYKNNQKWQYSVIYLHFRDLKLVWKVLKKHQIFMKHSTPCIFSKEKKLRWHCFIFNSENILENGKWLLKIFWSIFFIFGGPWS